MILTVVGEMTGAGGGLVDTGLKFACEEVIVSPSMCCRLRPPPPGVPQCTCVVAAPGGLAIIPAIGRIGGNDAAMLEIHGIEHKSF